MVISRRYTLVVIETQVGFLSSGGHRQVDGGFAPAPVPKCTGATCWWWSALWLGIRSSGRNRMCVSLLRYPDSLGGAVIRRALYCGLIALAVLKADRNRMSYRSCSKACAPVLNLRGTKPSFHEYDRLARSFAHL